MIVPGVGAGVVLTLRRKYSLSYAGVIGFILYFA